MTEPHIQPIFLMSERLGSVLDGLLNAAIDNALKRKRQVLLNACIRVLKDLALVPSKARVQGVARGVNGLADRGWWIICEDYRFVQLPEGTLPASEELQGRLSPEEQALDRALDKIPEVNDGKPFFAELKPHKFDGRGTALCRRCGLSNLDIIHEPVHEEQLVHVPQVNDGKPLGMQRTFQQPHKFYGGRSGLCQCCGLARLDFIHEVPEDRSPSK